jgi:LPXTG-motif cell wall-anchored protein
MRLEALAFKWMPKTGKSSLVGTLFGFLIFGLGFGFLAIYAWHWVAPTGRISARRPISGWFLPRILGKL